MNVMNEEKRQELANMLREAGEAHHQAYIDTNGADPDWPIWYADFLHSRIAALLKVQFTKSELVYLFVTLDRDLQRDAPGADWAEYYARNLLGRYGW